MKETNTNTHEEAPGRPVELEAGTYEILSKRLQINGQQLREKLNLLNQSRKEVFGSIDTELLTTERVTTENNCIPFDMIPINNHFIFGYNVHIGLKTETQLSDVFSIYAYKNRGFQPEGLDSIDDTAFVEDFKKLYKYYKNTRFVKFATIGRHLFMVFQVGQNSSDIKTFKWLADGNRLVYADNRSDHEYVFPHQHAFNWKKTNRNFQREGEFPHISIEDKVFVETGNREGLDFEFAYAAAEIDEYTNVLKKLFKVRDVILKINLAYIYSAAQADEYRTEPPFKLQGSYRDMNKIAEKVMPVMNDKELATLINTHYENEAQTLTTGAEANLSKYRELQNKLGKEDKKRWEPIKEAFLRKQKLSTPGGQNQVGQVLLQMENINEGLKDIVNALTREEQA